MQLVFSNRIGKKKLTYPISLTICTAIAGVDDNNNYTNATDARETLIAGQITNANTIITGKTTQLTT